MKTAKLPFQPDEIVFLRKNFYSMTNEELKSYINEYRSEKNQLSSHGFRERCYQMGLKRGIQIRWSIADEKKLKAWYKIIGNIQIAELLNQYGTSYRKINGKKVKRHFTKKHIEKKLKLLKLKRTREQIRNIMNDHRLCQAMNEFSSTDNIWTRGIRQAAKEEEVRVWSNRRVIKIDGHFIPFTRWFYDKFISPVPDNMKVVHIDMDPLNDDPDNLELRPYQWAGKKDYLRALPLIENRLKTEQKKVEKQWSQLMTKDERTIAMKEITRLTNIKTSIEKKLNRKDKNQKVKYYEPMEAF